MSKKDKARAQAPTSLDSERTWRYLQHADTIQSARQNFSLVAESMLVVAFFTVPSTLPAAKILRLAIALLGVVYTVGWFYMGIRLGARMEPLHASLRAQDPTYEIYLTAVPKHPSGKLVFLWVLPLSTLCFWCVLLWAALQ